VNDNAPLTIAGYGFGTYLLFSMGFALGDERV